MQHAWLTRLREDAQHAAQVHVERAGMQGGVHARRYVLAVDNDLGAGRSEQVGPARAPWTHRGVRHATDRAADDFDDCGPARIWSFVVAVEEAATDAAGRQREPDALERRSVD